MVNIYEVIKDWEAGEKTLEEANEALKGTGIYLDPEKNVIKEGTGAIVCEDVNKINGYAMLDTGTGSLDKVLIENGKTVGYSNGGFEVAYVIIGDSMFKVEDTQLVPAGKVKK